MYKVEVYSSRANNNNVSNDKKVVGSTQGPFKKDITIMEVVSYTKYTNTELVFLTTCEKIKGIKV